MFHKSETSWTLDYNNYIELQTLRFFFFFRKQTVTIYNNNEIRLNLWTFEVAPNTRINKIQRFKNKVVRIIVSSPRYAAVDTVKNRDIKILHTRDDRKYSQR